jgi:hypothetical protein
LHRDDRSDLLCRIAANERLLEANAAREIVRQAAPADLASMGVDRPDLRWQAARAYIRSARTAAIARIDLGLRRLVMLDRISASARRRAATVDESDLADAGLWFERKFGQPAPSLAYIPPSFAGRTSEAELLRLAGDQRRFEAARAARRRASAA